MRNNIKDKLQEELNKPIKTEPQVVYVLSRVRKLMEIDNSAESYRKLKAYCDWALHKQLNNVSPFSEVLKDFPNGDLSSYFAGFIDFKKEFLQFLSDHELTTSIYKNTESENNFNTILFDIYSDTPLVIESIKIKKSITLKNCRFSENKFEFQAIVQDD